MRIQEIVVSLVSPLVTVKCVLQIQDKCTDLSFTLIESDLYDAALEQGRASWENCDVVSVAKEKLNLDCYIK